MKKSVLVFFCFLTLMHVEACGQGKAPAQEIPQDSGQSLNPTDSVYTKEKNETMQIKITIGSAVFTASLADNPAAEAFRAMLPLTVDMNEHNRNEKYSDLPDRLPAAAVHPGTIQKGDIMLFGSSTLVLFYKTFTSSYSYTRIGRLDTTDGLEEALGKGTVTVTFENL